MDLDYRPPKFWPMSGEIPLVIGERPVMRPWYIQLPREGWFVYSLFAVDSSLIYIGMTGNLQQRLRSHARRFPNAVLAHTQRAKSERAVLRIEAVTIHLFDPPENRSPGRVDLIEPDEWPTIEAKKMQLAAERGEF